MPYIGLRQLLSDSKTIYKYSPHRGADGFQTAISRETSGFKAANDYETTGKQTGNNRKNTARIPEYITRNDKLDLDNLKVSEAIFASR